MNMASSRTVSNEHYFCLTLTPFLIPGTYKGETELQLERINVYYNEAYGD